MLDPVFQAWLDAAAAQADWVGLVCTGAFISTSIDLALRQVETIAGLQDARSSQLFVQYAPFAATKQVRGQS